MKRCLGCMELYEDTLNVCPHCGYVFGTKAEESVHMDPGTLLHAILAGMENLSRKWQSKSICRESFQPECPDNLR